MLHDLARTEIEKLRQHGVHALSYDEVASLQMAAIAVDEAVKSEGLPVGLPRPVRLTDDIVLFPMTLAAQDVLERATPWLKRADAHTAAALIAFLLVHGRDLALLRDVSTDRRTLLSAAKKWARALPVTAEELGSAVDMVLDAQDEQTFSADARAFYAVAEAARAAGDEETADRVRALLAALKDAERQKRHSTIAAHAWGAMTLQLAAITGCAPDVWAVQSSAEAVAAYVARLDFAALTSGLCASKAGADGAHDRDQKDALRRLYATTDAVARAHLKDRQQ